MAQNIARDSAKPHSVEGEAAQRAAYWPFAVVRAVPLAALACVIAFTSNHAPAFGLLVFGGFGIVTAVLLGLLSWFRLGQSGARPFFLAQAAVTLVFGVLALVFRAGGVPFVFFVFTAFAIITGFLELASGIRARRRFVAARDWMTIGGFTVIVAIAFLLVPPGYTQSFKDPDGVTRVLDSSVIVVGILGLYAGICAVFLVIGGLSAKWGTQTQNAASVNQASAEQDSASQAGPGQDSASQEHAA